MPVKGEFPLISLIGLVVTPLEAISIKRKLTPLCLELGFVLDGVATKLATSPSLNSLVLGMTEIASQT